VSNNQYSKTNPYGTDAGVYLEPSYYHQLIAQHGIRVMIEKTSVCPNYRGTATRMQHDTNCTLCDNGFVHYDPIECWAVFQQNDLVKLFLKEGIFNPGQALITIPKLDENGQSILISYFDKVTLLDQEERFNELLNKSRGNMDKLRYQALSVEFVMDSEGKRYYENAHFVLDKNQNIQWVDNQPRPEWNSTEGVGQTFTVTYRFRPVYRVMNLLHEGRYSSKIIDQYKSTTTFPQFMAIKKDFYVSKNDVETGMPVGSPLRQEEWYYNKEIEEPDV
jgi:hypothetical protein